MVFAGTSGNVHVIWTSPSVNGPVTFGVPTAGAAQAGLGLSRRQGLVDQGDLKAESAFEGLRKMIAGYMASPGFSAEEWAARLEQEYERTLVWQSIMNFPTGYAMSCREIPYSLMHPTGWWDITVPAYLGETRDDYVDARGF